MHISFLPISDSDILLSAKLVSTGPMEDVESFSVSSKYVCVDLPVRGQLTSRASHSRNVRQNIHDVFTVTTVLFSLCLIL